ncbi:class I SAM-dependent methyltransferase [Pedobacter caeni]|uniref:UbiE/COQ5 methyltransferase family protein n=1 Tax=Pedobacter caeni TaxID=288992 RepID=A0A1M5AHG7_9SPHI|nr:class I SAM-dependent methyltransferase [Pedobacter caeni]SHF29663.1 ubiE/COQ5 methyltransferase family protein [Pedobacter caeni]
MNTATKTTSFSGNIPINYEEHLGPLLFESYAIDMAQRVEKLKPSSVLEIACGTGRVTNHLLKVLPQGATLVATDLNPAMLSLAKEMVRETAGVKWAVADSMALPFEDGSFDCIVAQFGVMFYSDKVKANQEAFRVLKKGGTLIFNSWNMMSANIAVQMVKELLDEYFPQNPPNFYDIPFSYFDPGLIKMDLSKGGFGHVDTALLKVNGYSPNAFSAAKGLLEGTPVSVGITERSAGILPELIEVLAGRLAERFGAKDLTVPLEAIVTTAIK